MFHVKEIISISGCHPGQRNSWDYCLLYIYVESIKYMVIFCQSSLRDGSNGSIKQYSGFTLFCVKTRVLVGIMFNFEKLKRLNL